MPAFGRLEAMNRQPEDRALEALDISCKETVSKRWTSSSRMSTGPYTVVKEDSTDISSSCMKLDSILKVDRCPHWISLQHLR